MLHSLVKQYLDDNGIKHTFVAKGIGVDKSVFSSMISGKRKITAEEYIKICAVIKVNTHYFAEKLTGVR